MIKDILEKSIQNALKNMALREGVDVLLEHPADMTHGEYSTNVAMVLAKKVEENPKDLAERIVADIVKQKLEEVARVEVAGNGFINFYLTRQFFADRIDKILQNKDTWGSNDILKGKKVMIEYTDPNPFKEFHIGHLMSNAIGESLSRVYEFSGAEVRRANYQGDVGLHVAKALWGKIQKPELSWGEAYAYGATHYTNHKEEVDEINKKVYEQSDAEINKLYEAGREQSLESFEQIYKKLGTAFDYYFFESETGVFGKQLVEEYLKKGVFEESQGAVIFRGEDYGLHTRVFINSEGLPTYEAKELGLAKIKYEKYPYDISVVVTGNEIQEYFKVIMQVMCLVFPKLAEKTKHVPHGMLRLPSGKMSSRTGDVVSGESLLESVKHLVLDKMEEREIEDKEKASLEIAVGAIKYVTLKQSVGKDIVFDVEKSLSFDGDSGPYLQYANARALSVLEKAEQNDITADIVNIPEKTEDVEQLLYQFPEVVCRALDEHEPHYLVTYLTELAGAFNTFYAQRRIADAGEYAPYYVAITRAFTITIDRGLSLLGIQAPQKM